MLKFILIIPLIPAVALGMQKGLSWEGYLVVYLITLSVLALGILLLALLYYIFG